MMRLPPGVPTTMTALPSLVTMVGLIDDDAARGDGVGFTLRQPVHVRHADLDGE